MRKICPRLRITTLTLLVGLLAIGNVACTNSEPTPSANASTTTAPPPPPAPQPEIIPAANITVVEDGEDSYEEAVAIASGAVLLSKSAVVRDDWSLVASRWQEAVELLKTIPETSNKYQVAQEKLSQYQSFYQQALTKAKPPAVAQTQTKGNTNPEFFLVPIKKRLAGIPVIEVRFNEHHKFDMAFDTGASATLITGSMAYKLGLKSVGKRMVGIADGSVAELSVAILKSISIDSRRKINVSVAVAPNMPIGLLGQDFFAGYDVTIKQNVIEFQKR